MTQPPQDEFILVHDEGEDGAVWMQCRVCFDVVEVGTLADAVQAWTVHVCEAKK